MGKTLQNSSKLFKTLEYIERDPRIHFEISDKYLFKKYLNLIQRLMQLKELSDLCFCVFMRCSSYETMSSLD